MSQLRARLVDHVLRVRPGGLRDERTGEIAAAAVQGVDALESYFARYLPQLVLGALVPRRYSCGWSPWTFPPLSCSLSRCR